MEIRFATAEDIKEILEFIKQHWNAEHIFVKCPQLFEVCHKEDDDSVNYVIAKNNNKLFGICGFIYANHSETPDIWLALWKVIPSKNPGLGLAIVKFLEKEKKCRILCCNGIKKEVRRLYEFMGFSTGKLRHYYRLADRATYKIANIKCKKTSIQLSANDYLLHEVHSESEFLKLVSDESLCTIKPYKDKAYITAKYFNNVAYTYKVWGCTKENNTSITTWIFAREIKKDDVKILRIVDVIGEINVLEFLGFEIQKIMEQGNYEYLDFYQYGIPNEIMLQMGLVERTEEDINVIPNYFEPYIAENIELYFFTNNLESFYVFKGDGDQERTNFIPTAFQ